MKKRIIALVILTLLFTQSFAMSFTSDSLTQLGLINSTDFDQFALRGDFIKTILKIINQDDNSGGQVVFSDVDSDSAYFGAVGKAYDLGIIYGTGDMKFRPEDPIAFSEATKILLNILGYADNSVANQNDSALAARVKLTKGITLPSDQWMTYEQLSKLILNAVEIPCFSVTYKDGKIKYSADGDTLLEKYQSIKKARGVLRSVYDSTIDKNAVANPNEVIIENMMFSTTGQDYSSLLGASVDYLYVDEGDSTTIAAMEMSAQASILEIKLEDIYSVSNKNVYYYNSDNQSKAVKLDSNVSIAYNGEPITAYTEELFLGDNGAVRFVFNNSSCTSALITEYEDFVADSIDTKNWVVYDKYKKDSLGMAEKLNLSKIDEERIVNSTGALVISEDVSRYNVLSVKKTQSGEIKQVIVSSRSIEGTITKLDLSENKIYVDGLEQRISESIMDNATFKVGDVGTFYLNVSGLVAGVYTTRESVYGYAVKYYITDESEATEMLRVLTTEGDVRDFGFSLRYTLDGKKVKSENYLAKGALSDEAGFLPQIIKYKINSDQKIILLDTLNLGSDEETDTALASVYKKTASLRYLSASSTFANHIPIGSSTIFFDVPDEEKSENRGLYSNEDYQVITKADIESNETYTVAAYSSNINESIPEAIVRYSNKGDISATGQACIISKIMMGANSNDEIVPVITYFSAGAELSAPLNDNDLLTGEELSVGDMIRVKLDKNKEISALQYIYSINDGVNDTTPFHSNITNSAADAYGRFTMFKAHVFKKEANFLFVAASSDLSTSMNLTNLAVYNIAATSLVIYDKDENPKVRTGVMWDLTESNGADLGDFIIVHSYNNVAKTIYVIK